MISKRVVLPWPESSRGSGNCCGELGESHCVKWEGSSPADNFPAFLKCLSMSQSLQERIELHIRNVPDFPKPGIVFKDIAPLLRQPEVMHDLLDWFVALIQSTGAQSIAAIESRGFIVGMPVAARARVPFIPVRKRGKLPGEVVQESYSLEYGDDAVEIQADALRPGEKVLIIDDVLATGGTAAATNRLLRRVGADVVGCGFLLELSFLKGRDKLLQDSSTLETQSLIMT